MRACVRAVDVSLSAECACVRACVNVRMSQKTHALILLSHPFDDSALPPLPSTFPKRPKNKKVKKKGTHCHCHYELSLGIALGALQVQYQYST